MKVRSVWLKAFGLWAALTLLCGGAYPLLVTVVGRLLFPEKAGGSLLRSGEKVVGSSLLARAPAGPGYFRPRPSACSWSTLPSGASNAAPTGAALTDSVRIRRARFQTENEPADGAEVPAEMLCASASGLDPHISVESARLQAGRVARERGLDEKTGAGLQKLIEDRTEPRLWGLFGLPRVNVTLMNFMLDTIPEFRNFHQEDGHDARPDPAEK
ncbi:potassium-transporting ATPase subunit C [bacterium]|nr:potassium-transporting ATPase subunit C [bacterium]